MPKLLTTGDVAKICGCAPKTVTKWIDSGKLKGYKLPMSKDRRVSFEDLTGFLAEHHFPVDANGQTTKHKIITVACPFPFVSLLDTLNLSVIHTYNVCEAGIEGVKHDTDCVLIDPAIGRLDCSMLICALRKNIPRLPHFISVSPIPPFPEIPNIGFSDNVPPSIDADLLRVVLESYHKEHRTNADI